jgi:hypothetical protein
MQPAGSVDVDVATLSGGRTMQRVEIRVKERIDAQWSEWLDGLAITHTNHNETVLTGPFVDQAALYGLVAKLRDLGLPLLAINVLEELDDERE